MEHKAKRQERRLRVKVARTRLRVHQAQQKLRIQVGSAEYACRRRVLSFCTFAAVARVADRMKNIKHVVLVLSGKGGVGKSTVSAQLARALAGQGKSVGLLDVDICGPSAPTMFGLVGQRVHQSATGWSPVWVEENLGVMSIGFMLPGQDDAVIWRGPRKNGLIQQFLCDVEWGNLDYLIIDTPPGTSDEHISIVQFLKRSPLAGAVVVTTPQEVAMADVRKELNFCKKTNTPVIGIVENMRGFSCRTCGTITDIFSAADGQGGLTGAAAMAQAFQVPLLGTLPLDPVLTQACESGGEYGSAEGVGSSTAAGQAAFAQVVAAMRSTVEGSKVNSSPPVATAASSPEASTLLQRKAELLAQLQAVNEQLQAAGVAL